MRGWILGSDGKYRVNPKWTNCEETLQKNSSSQVKNIKKEMEPLVKKEEESRMVDIGKTAVEKEMMKRAGLVEDVRPAVKTKKCGPLGPRGLRKNGGNNYGGPSAPNYSEDGPKVEGWALVEKNMKQEGYGIFPPSFAPPSFKSKKPFHFVDQDLYLTVTVDGLKLASACREELKFDIFNPFSQEMPVGQRLPRYIFFILYATPPNPTFGFPPSRS